MSSILSKGSLLKILAPARPDGFDAEAGFVIGCFRKVCFRRGFPEDEVACSLPMVIWPGPTLQLAAGSG